MSRVHIDFETRSLIDLRSCGVYKYVEHPSTDIWCMAYSFDDEDEVLCWEPGQTCHDRLLEHLRFGGEIHAWNAQFERTLWRIMHDRYGWPKTFLRQFHCTMARAAAHGLPLSLDSAAKALGAPEKDTEGAGLMMRMCRPRSTKGGKVVWWNEREKLDRLIAYCKQDVRVEKAMFGQLNALSPKERRVWILDQQINDRGVPVDRELLNAAKYCAEIATERANQRLAEVTNGEVLSVTAVADLAAWITAHGVECDSVAKDAVKEMLSQEPPADVREVLEIRAEAGKSSVAKLDSMIEYAGVDDDRMRGLLAYHGASTGRWAGRGPQPQNFPIPIVADPERFIPFVLARDVDAIEKLGQPLPVLSSLLRSGIKASAGGRLLAADYAGIEARVVAWLAGQEDLLELFRRKEDVYKDMAKSIYTVPVADVNPTQRKVGKEAVLGLGFQMGADKFQANVKKKTGMDLSVDFCKEVVAAYRTKYPKIPKLWGALQEAAIIATRDLKTVRLKTCSITFKREGEWLYCILPSGRRLSYYKPRVTPRETPWGTMRDSLSHHGFSSITKQWGPLHLYGGLLTENVTQAVARDIMVEGMLELDRVGYPIILTVHDEIIAEQKGSDGTLEQFERIMSTVPAWATGCPISVESWEGERYKK